MLGLEASGCPANTKNVYNWFVIFTKENRAGGKGTEVVF